MPASRRQHIRFSLDIPAIRCTKDGERQQIILHQISIGGCLTEWDENVYTGEEFRLEIQLPNKNWLPLTCKTLYQFSDNGIGAKFPDITKFEQELIAQIISHALKKEGLPMQIDPFAKPSGLNQNTKKPEPKITDHREETEDLLEIVMSGD